MKKILKIWFYVGAIPTFLVFLLITLSIVLNKPLPIADSAFWFLCYVIAGSYCMTQIAYFVLTVMGNKELWMTIEQLEHSKKEYEENKEAYAKAKIKHTNAIIASASLDNDVKELLVKLSPQIDILIKQLKDNKDEEV